MQVMGTSLKKVLVVDDDPTILMTVGLMIKAKGFETEECDSGQKVVDLLQSAFEFDCVVLDYSMPETNGMEVLQKIREAGHQVPALLCSGMNASEMNFEKYEFRPEATITKPFQFDALFQKINSLIND